MVSVAPKRHRAAVDVFRYRDYREFLAAYYAAKKPSGLSYRAFSKAAGVGAPNYLKLVIEGKRNLSAAMAARFAHACRLHAEAATYFQTLVAFNQARTDEQRNELHDQLVAFPRFRVTQRLELAQKDYHSTWYIPVVRELIACPAFREDAEWIASVVYPSITKQEATHALAVLNKLGLVAHDESGRLRQVERAVSTGEQASGLHIRNYHAEMMQRATRAMEFVPAADRYISSLTLSTSPTMLAEVRRRLLEFRQELVALCDSDPAPERIMQLNLQWFPLSTPLLSPASKNSRKGPPQNDQVHRGHRCATPVRHEESNILEYLSDDQRHWRRCSGGRMPWLFFGGP